jgi:hypothetical protein
VSGAVVLLRRFLSWMVTTAGTSSATGFFRRGGRL